MCFSQLPSWDSAFIAQRSSPGEAKPRAPTLPQKSAAPGHCTSGFAFCRRCQSVPSVTGLTAPSCYPLQKQSHQSSSQCLPPNYANTLLPPSMVISSLVLSKSLPLVSSSLECLVPKLCPQTWSPPILNRDVVEQYLVKEVLIRRVAGPFTSSSLASPLHTNHFDVIPKRGCPRKWRLIVDLSSSPSPQVVSMMASTARTSLCPTGNVFRKLLRRDWHLLSFLSLWS